MALDFEHCSFFLHSVVGISHDRNEHIEESDLGEESRDDEDPVADGGIVIVFKTIHVEFAEDQQVLIYRGVDYELIEDGLDDDAFIVHEGIELDHVHCTSRVDQYDDQDDHEVLYVA